MIRMPPEKTTQRPKLLMLVQTLPYPPDSGVAIRTYNVLRQLSVSFDVTALCFYRWKDGQAQQQLPASVKALAKFARVRAFPIPQEHSRVRWLRDHFSSVLTGRVYTDFVYESESFRSAVRAALREHEYQLVHIDSLDLASYLNEVSTVPVVCVHHNIESELLARRAPLERTRIARAYVRYQARMMRASEVRHCAGLALNIVVSEADRSTLVALVPEAQCIEVPNGVDVETFQPDAQATSGIVFVGGTTWFPNLDALEYFARDVLPHVRKTYPDVTVTWVGRASSEERRRFWADHRIRLTGYVDDVRPFVHQGACFVVPLRVGGGTRLKILDAWAMGKAVVSTSIGCEGLAAANGLNIIVANTAIDFARAVCTVLEDDSLRLRLGAMGRATVVDRYSWDTIGSAMRTAYANVVVSSSLQGGPRRCERDHGAWRLQQEDIPEDAA